MPETDLREAIRTLFSKFDAQTTALNSLTTEFRVHLESHARVADSMRDIKERQDKFDKKLNEIIANDLVAAGVATDRAAVQNFTLTKTQTVVSVVIAIATVVSPFLAVWLTHIVK